MKKKSDSRNYKVILQGPEEMQTRQKAGKRPTSLNLGTDPPYR
jgi:hypothetical protein